MKRHMTQMELTKTRRLIENGVTDIPKIQEFVFCHEDNIQQVLDTYDIPAAAPAPAPKKRAAPKKKAAAKKGGAAARAAKLPDPMS